MKKTIAYIFLRFVAFTGMFSFLICSCAKDELLAKNEKESNNIKTIESNSDSNLCDRLNSNIIFFKNIVEIYVCGDSVVAPVKSKIGDSGYAFTIDFSDSCRSTFYNIHDKDLLAIPSIRVKKIDNDYFWVFEGVNELSMAKINGGENVPQFRRKDSMWQVTLNKSDWYDISAEPLEEYYFRSSLSLDEDFLLVECDNSAQFILPTPLISKTLKHGVPNKAFYKDVFLDAGYALNNGGTLNAACSLGLTLEAVNCSTKTALDSSWQNRVISGSNEDYNGRLLYPDGQPRYKVLFVRGGVSAEHGRSLRSSGRDHMRQFVDNGGSYIGTCAGAFFASNGSDLRPNYKYYLALWPGQVLRTNYKNAYTGFAMEKNSPLLSYDLSRSISVIDSLYHSEGCLPQEWPEGSVVLARYVCPKRPLMHDKPVLWQYKKSNQSGLVIMMGSHPEFASSGKCLTLTECMFRYAMDNVGEVSVKGLLRNGEVRTMDKHSRDALPAYTSIGDLQCHHFAVYIPRGARNVCFSVSSSSDCDFVLAVDKTGYAFPEEASYKTTAKGSSKELQFPSLFEGLYYVAVKNLTTVTAVETERGQEYTGRTDVLNGVPYSIKVSWE